MFTIRRTREFIEWASKLRDVRAKTRIALRIDRVAIGNLGDIKPVGDGVSELRIDYGPGYRIYFIRDGAVIIILLCGGDKSTQKQDIDRAKRLAKEWKD